MKLIDSKVRKRIEEGNLFVLRTKTGVPLNVSYSPEGLLLTMNKYGKLLCYKDAKPVLREYEGKVFVEPEALSVGGLAPSDNVIIEKFIPKDHLINGKLNTKLQGFEFRWIHKALRLLSDFNNKKDPARTVYSQPSGGHSGPRKV